MNFKRNSSVRAICLTLLTLLTLSSCGGNQKEQQTTAASPSESNSPAIATSPSESSSPAIATSPLETTSPNVSPATSEVGVKPQGTSCPAEAPIKGNNGKRGKIYHLPKSRNYDKIKPEECFADVSSAEKAGYRAHKKSKG